MTIAKPDFVEKQGTELVGLYCKRCGEKIAGITERAKGDPKIGRFGERIETKVERFSRFGNFTELKMVMQDGARHAFHITTGCNKCLTPSLSMAELQELHDTDIDEQALELGSMAIVLKQRVPIAIVGIKVGGGIV